MKASIIIPAYNRVTPLRYTLRSITDCIFEDNFEVVLVDDGSDPPLEDLLSEKYPYPLKIIRQQNEGSISARLNGFRNSSGEFVLFLDSDDLILPEKLPRQVSEMERVGADLSYCDAGHVSLDCDFEDLKFEPRGVLPEAQSSAELLLFIQPPPHCLMYRRSYLEKALFDPIVPSKRIFDSVGDVWLNYNLAPYTAKVVKVDGALSATGEHEEERYTEHWEQLGIDALVLSLAFKEYSQRFDVADEVKQLMGECAFISWRKLPRRFHKEFERQTLKLWRDFSGNKSRSLGGPVFQSLAALIGCVNAGRLMRYCLRPKYSSIATLPREELDSLINSKFLGLEKLLSKSMS